LFILKTQIRTGLVFGKPPKPYSRRRPTTEREEQQSESHPGIIHPPPFRNNNNILHATSNHNLPFTPAPVAKIGQNSGLILNYNNEHKLYYNIYVD